MRLLPKNPWRPLVLVAIGAALIGWKVRANRQQQRLYDDARLVVEQDRVPLNAFLQRIQTECSADIRIIITPTMDGESIEAFAVRRMRELGVGRETNGRGLLLVYDVAHRRARIEVGPHLQGEITDAFVGYLMREHVRRFFEGGNPSLGLRTTLFIIHDRLRRALLGEGFDPAFISFVDDVRRLAIGGGASARVSLDSVPGAFVNQRASAETKAYFSPQPTVDAAYTRYLEWLARGPYEWDVPLFDIGSQGHLQSITMTPGYKDYWLQAEYGRKFAVIERGDYALVYCTDDPLVSPHFFHRTPAGWQMDILMEVMLTRNLSGGWYTWRMWPEDNETWRTFEDRVIDAGGILRLAGGDNRLLPGPWSAQSVNGDTGVEHLTAREAADRVQASSGRPVVLFLYQSGQKTAIRAVAELARRYGPDKVSFVTFAIDETIFTPWLPGTLREADAPWPAVHIYPWLPGQLSRYMQSIGVPLNRTWVTPAVAVRDRTGRTVFFAEGVRDDLGALENAIRAAR